MSITKTLLQTNITNYSSMRDSLLKKADQLKAEAAKCIDDANTNHGAALSCEKLLEELENSQNDAPDAQPEPGNAARQPKPTKLKRSEGAAKLAAALTKGIAMAPPGKEKPEKQVVILPKASKKTKSVTKSKKGGK